MASANSVEYRSRRSNVMARHGMVASSQPLASSAGLEVLREGGTAADAAVAMASMLALTEPSSTGIGGDCFALYYDAKTKKISAMNASGRAPAELSIERVEKEHLINRQRMMFSDPYHAHTITVPGAAAGWCDLVQRHGKMPLSRVLGPAIKYAEEGFPVAPLTAPSWQAGARGQLRTALNGSELTIDGRGPRAGEIFKNPGLARTFRALVAGGKAAYYRGEIGKALVAVVRQAGGVMSEEDLASHETTWDEPISTVYRNVRVWECPPNGQGLAALLALNVLEGFEVSKLERDGSARWHLLIEAMRVAFADTAWYVADPKFSKIPINGLLDKNYAAERRKVIRADKATLDTRQGSPVASSDTVYFCTMDGQGNACSFINSNYMGFGTGIVPKGWGFPLQNRGHCFSLDANHPNALAPRKRPYHTIIPGMLTKPDGELIGPFGVMGGVMQPQGHMQVVVAMVDDGLDPQGAVDRPRFCIETAMANGEVSLEEGIDATVVEALKGMGHVIGGVVGGGGRSLFGRGQIIRRDDAGVMWAGSDGRADGCAMGF